MHSCSSTCSGSAATRHFRSQAAAQLLKGEPHGLGMWATSEVPAPERLSMMRVCRRGVLNSGFLFTFQVWGKRGLFFRARGRFCKVKRWGGRRGEGAVKSQYNLPFLPISYFDCAWRQQSLLFKLGLLSPEPWSQSLVYHQTLLSIDFLDTQVKENSPVQIQSAGSWNRKRNAVCAQYIFNFHIYFSHIFFLLKKS